MFRVTEWEKRSNRKQGGGRKEGRRGGSVGRSGTGQRRGSRDRKQRGGREEVSTQDEITNMSPAVFLSHRQWGRDWAWWRQPVKAAFKPKTGGLKCFYMNSDEQRSISFSWWEVCEEQQLVNTWNQAGKLTFHRLRVGLFPPRHLRPSSPRILLCLRGDTAHTVGSSPSDRASVSQPGSQLTACHHHHLLPLPLPPTDSGGGGVITSSWLTQFN